MGGHPTTKTDLGGETMKKENAPTATGQSAKVQRNSSTSRAFQGTDNPRQLRALQRLLVGPLPRERLDKVAGCSNGPDLIAALRRLGLDIPCERTHYIDRDGKLCRPGVYSLTFADRRRLYRWMAKRGEVKR